MNITKALTILSKEADNYNKNHKLKMCFEKYNDTILVYLKDGMSKKVDNDLEKILIKYNFTFQLKSNDADMGWNDFISFTYFIIKPKRVEIIF